MSAGGLDFSCSTIFFNRLEGNLRKSAMQFVDLRVSPNGGIRHVYVRNVVHIIVLTILCMISPLLCVATISRTW